MDERKRVELNVPDLTGFKVICLIGWMCSNVYVITVRTFTISFF
jgi:hypothetical protein